MVPQKKKTTPQNNKQNNNQTNKQNNNKNEKMTTKKTTNTTTTNKSNKTATSITTSTTSTTTTTTSKSTTSTSTNQISIEPTSHNNTHSTHIKKTTQSISTLNTQKYPKIDYKLSTDESPLKPNISIVIIGHVDSGKSTLMGHLLYLQGEISDRILEKYEKESKKIGKNSFHFAWAMDEGTEERKRGVTVDIAYKYFSTNTKRITAMDAPGHRDFIPNMITGTSAADTALLVIDSNKNAFESGFFQGGQTKEHAVLARSLGVKQIIVCINKLELVDWSQDRFTYIEHQVRDFLNKLDYADNDIYFIPVSGLKGTNLCEVDTSITHLKWYQGKSLIEIIDSLPEPVRDLEAPVRFSISDTGSTVINSLQGIGIFGKLETGVVYEGEEYIIQPAGIRSKIRSLAVDSEKCGVVMAGQSAELLLNVDKTVAEEIRPGNIMCMCEYSVPIVTEVKVQILTLDIKYPLSMGQAMFVHCQSQKAPCKIKKIEKIISKDGKTARNNAM